jgi:MFS superfamily sulfate permease-like transporter
MRRIDRRSLIRTSRKFLPFLGWFDDYGLTELRIDLVSGLTVALVLIPQSMAYAQLAGLPVYYGLYAAFLPPMIASLFGSSRQLATGPVAVVSLMTSASLEPLATAGSEQYIAYAILLAFTVGLFQFLLGVLRLGLVINFLSHPVVNGFTNAAAIIIGTSQLSKMFGVHVDKAEHHYETIIRVIEAAFEFTHWPTLAMGVAAFAVMIGLKKLDQRIPYVLVAVVLATLVSWLVGFRHDATTSIENVESAEVQEDIRSFNEAVGRIAALSEKRSELNQEIAEVEEKANADRDTLLDLRHEKKELDYEIEEAKEEAARLRADLRSIFFAAEGEEGGTMTFRPRPEEGHSGRTWRLRVGNTPLDTSTLTFAGGGDVVGVIPRGLPKIGVPELNISTILRLLPFSIIISLLGFMEAISIAKAMAAKTGQRLDPNQELIGQGLANIVGCMGRSYPTSGSFSRSAVNLQAGAVSGLSSVFTSLAVVVVLLFFTPLLYHLPQAVLAAIIMMAVFGLVNVSGFIHAWKARWYDGAISIISFLATLAFAPHLDRGIFVGVGLSLLVFLYRSMRPKVASLSLHERGHADADHYGLRECDHMAIIRFDGPLFFANSSYLEDQVLKRVRSMPELKVVHIVANGITDIDASGEEVLSLLVDRLRSGGYEVTFSGLNENVTTVLKRTYLWQRIGEENIFHTLAQALEVVHPRAHVDAREETCPLISFEPGRDADDHEEGAGQSLEQGRKE